jgi:hypothetical protein
MIEAWWRSLKHQWLFLHSLDSVATIRRLVAFYVHERNHVLPHSAFRGQTPDEMYFGTGDVVPADLTSRAAAARRARVAVNRSAACETCPSLNAAGPPAADSRVDHGIGALVHLEPIAGTNGTARRRMKTRGRDRLGSKPKFINRPCRPEWRELARRHPECP